MSALSKRITSVAIGKGESTDTSVSARNETVADLGNCQDRNGNQRRPEIEHYLGRIHLPAFNCTAIYSARPRQPPATRRSAKKLCFPLSIENAAGRGRDR